jgi:glycerophosphoryl diester phosphodiesterase
MIPPSAPGQPRPEAIGHRGAPTQRLENTLDGFLLAIEQGADAVELDVHVTGDGVAVVHHDEDAHGLAINGTALDALLEAAPEIPTLEDVLRAIGDRATVYVELKGVGIEAEVIDVVQKHGSRHALHSFDHAAVERAAALAPDIARGVLVDAGTTNPIQALRRAVARTGARDAWPHWSLVSADMMRAAGEMGVRVIAWTVNSHDSARHLASLGVAGLCTDDVRMLANSG